MPFQAIYLFVPLDVEREKDDKRHAPPARGSPLWPPVGFQVIAMSQRSAEHLLRRPTALMGGRNDVNNQSIFPLPSGLDRPYCDLGQARYCIVYNPLLEMFQRTGMLTTQYQNPTKIYTIYPLSRPVSRPKGPTGKEKDQLIYLVRNSSA